MRKKIFLAALFLIVAGLQTAWGQGFRVYKSDGTVAQFSMRTDSIVFYDGIGTDVDFGPFTPVNQCIAGTWYKSKTETLTFGEDGTTDYIADATYEFMPYQGSLVIFNASGAPVQVLRVARLTSEMLLLATGSSPADFTIYTRTQPKVLVARITLNKTLIRLKPDETMRLTATVEPADADNPDVTWTSSDETVAEVNSSGRVTANALGTCVITCAATDGSGVTAKCKVNVAIDNSGTIFGRDYVDLGLPSGTLWATCNVGASKPEEYGDYFAWGETTTKSTYDWSTYKHCNGSSTTFTKYCTQSIYSYNGISDNKRELDSEDDVATANWGSSWQMPSKDQFNELINSEYTTAEWTEVNSVNGRMITSKLNGNSIFLPAAGYSNTDPYLVGAGGYYWSRSLYSYLPLDAYKLDYSSGGISVGSSTRSLGLTVRPVRRK